MPTPYASVCVSPRRTDHHLCVFSIMWFFFHFYDFFKAHNGWINPVTVSYPVWDMLLIFAIVLLIRRAQNNLHTSLIILPRHCCQIWSNIVTAIRSPSVPIPLAFLYYPFWYLGCLLLVFRAVSVLPPLPGVPITSRPIFSPLPPRHETISFAGPKNRVLPRTHPSMPFMFPCFCY